MNLQEAESKGTGIQAPIPSFLPLVLGGFNGAWQP
jgi:hypothetical protein